MYAQHRYLFEIAAKVSKKIRALSVIFVVAI
jgi:hypothetical protein